MTEREIEPEYSRAVERGLALRLAARRAYGQAVLYRALDPDDAERRLRQALATAVSALNWLEDSDFEDAVHREIHDMGRYAREHFADGCHLTWIGTRYQHECPVVIGHKRFGFSAGFVANVLQCSICGLDSSECPHRSTLKYEVPGGIGPAGVCRVCLREECEDHDPNELFEVWASRLVREVETFEEVSVVGRPIDPDARLTAVPIDTGDLAQALGPGFTPGMPLACSICLEPCRGFVYLDDRE